MLSGDGADGIRTNDAAQRTQGTYCPPDVALAGANWMVLLCYWAVNALIVAPFNGQLARDEPHHGRRIPVAGGGTSWSYLVNTA
jgi:hypothetical protein